MGLPQFRTCCCGCTVRSGTLILLWLYVIFWLLSMIKAIPSIVTMKDNSSPSDLRVISASQFLASVVMTPICIAGLHGVYKDRHSYLIPFLSLNGGLIMLEIIGLLVIVIVLPFVTNKNKVSTALPATVGFVIVVFIHIGFSGYLWLVVYSYYQVVKKRSLSRDIP